MPAASFVTINDGTIIVEVPSCSMFTGNISRSEIGSGRGETEYADGHAEAWIRFERNAYTIEGNGPAPHGLWALSIAAATWTVTVTSFDNDGSTDQWTVLPNRPVDTRNINTGRTGWTLNLNAA